MFARTDKAAEPWADEWRDVLDKSPTDVRLLVAAAAAVVCGAVLRPALAGQVAYAAAGVGIGFGSTKFLKFASGGGLLRLAGRLRPRDRLRKLLLRLDPTLEEQSGESIGWKDLRGPRLGGSSGPGWLPKPPKPPWGRA